MPCPFVLQLEAKDFKDALEFLTVKHLELQAKDVYYEQLEVRNAELEKSLFQATDEIAHLQAELGSLRAGSAAFMVKLADTQERENADVTALMTYLTALQRENAALRGAMAPPVSALCAPVESSGPLRQGVRTRGAQQHDALVDPTATASTADATDGSSGSVEGESSFTSSVLNGLEGKNGSVATIGSSPTPLITDSPVAGLSALSLND